MASMLDKVLSTHKRGGGGGITSICSAHPWVLRAAMLGNGTLLVESTCNQVNQFGGYTGLTPQAFAAYLHSLADEHGFPSKKLTMGGDHLGPSPWQNEPASSAMQKADQLVRACVQAGYTKIHLDASMKLGDDDPSCPLDVNLIAERTARLAKTAEDACSVRGKGCPLHYVIGSEVPIPGGATTHEAGVHVTRVEDVRQMLETAQSAFIRQRLEAAWERVIALVVQPGVEFGDDFIQVYKPETAQQLSHFIEGTPFLYEAHSTDYQDAKCLRELVRDHFAILKVGPALTFAFREAVFALARIEKELIAPEKCSRIIESLDEAMLRNPVHWRNHYHGNEDEVAQARKYSRSDRIRYYWAEPRVQASLDLLLKNLGDQPIPLSLLNQHLPRQHALIQGGKLTNSVESILMESVSAVLADYKQACEPFITY